jgi:hypothetical protein
MRCQNSTKDLLLLFGHATHLKWPIEEIELRLILVGMAWCAMLSLALSDVYLRANFSQVGDTI